MSDINLRFCRLLLKGVVGDVRKRYPAIKVSDASVLKMSGGGTNQWWLFEFMDPAVGRFAIEVQADNAFHARALGWEKWLEAKGIGEDSVTEPWKAETATEKRLARRLAEEGKVTITKEKRQHFQGDLYKRPWVTREVWTVTPLK